MTAKAKDPSVAFPRGNVNLRICQPPDLPHKSGTERISIFDQIHQIASRIPNYIEPSHFGIDRGEFDVLATLFHNGPPYKLSPTALYTYLMITSGGMTKRFKRLNSGGLIRRVPSPNDRRSLLVELTDEGHAAIRAALEQNLLMENIWLSTIPADKRLELAQLLQMVSIAIDSLSAPKDPVGKIQSGECINLSDIPNEGTT